MFEELKQIFGRQGFLAQYLPGFECRNSQLEMALAVGEALEKDRPLLVEAPTGIGKTLAYLVPAILSRRRVVISTGTKNLQDQIFEKDIPFLKKHFNQNLKAICVKGRLNYLCRRRFLAFLKEPTIIGLGMQPALKKLHLWYQKTATGDRAEVEWLPDNSVLWREISSSSDKCVGSECDYYNSCFITRLKQKAANCDLLIVNHHLYFADLALKQDNFGAVLPGHEAVIFDEAHQLDHVASSYFGFELSLFKFLELVHDVKKELSIAKVRKMDEINMKLQALETDARRYFEVFERAPGRKRLEEVRQWDELEKVADKITQSLNSLAGDLVSFEQMSPGLSACKRRSLNLSHLMDVFTTREDPDLVYWYESRRRGVFLHATPINVSPYLDELLFKRIGSVILTSATLAIGEDFSFVRQCLGVPDETDEMVLSSHFDFKENLIVYIPRDISEPSSPKFLEQFCQKVWELLLISQGRALILFTSYKNMEEAYSMLKEKDLPYKFLLQGEKPKNTLLKEFRQDLHSILLATGSFWEGVDVPGPSLSSVIIDKLPFEVPSDPILVARLKRLRDEGYDPFWHYQVPQAILNLKQGVGRLIRTVEDRGMVAIMDVRIWEKVYGKKFLSNLPDCKVTSDINEVAEFFRDSRVENFSQNAG
ncbi:MAG: ATP-dependent DNA helicase [Deltaproteobacteria bacterium]|nr:MAG: ATP-dependent DNA helicase [Deltaproteobacteria bacterium]